MPTPAIHAQRENALPARLITDKDVLEAAAGLLAVEAYHAGEIRTLLRGLRQFKAARAISDARDLPDGPGSKDQGIRREGSSDARGALVTLPPWP